MKHYFFFADFSTPSSGPFLGSAAPEHVRTVSTMSLSRTSFSSYSLFSAVISLAFFVSTSVLLLFFTSFADHFYLSYIDLFLYLCSFSASYLVLLAASTARGVFSSICQSISSTTIASLFLNSSPKLFQLAASLIRTHETNPSSDRARPRKMPLHANHFHHHRAVLSLHRRWLVARCAGVQQFHLR